MLVITEKIRDILKEKQLSENKLAQMIEYHSGSLNKMIRGEKPFPEDKIQKIAPILEVSLDEIKGWILADKYPKNLLEKAIKVKQKTQLEEGKLILTTKIDKILKQKGISRTGLSELIVYSQGKLNEMIIGKEPMSPLVISKITPALEVSEDEIKSWIIADKSLLKALQVAQECLP